MLEHFLGPLHTDMFLFFVKCFYEISKISFFPPSVANIKECLLSSPAVQLHIHFDYKGVTA